MLRTLDIDTKPRVHVKRLRIANCYRGLVDSINAGQAGMKILRSNRCLRLLVPMFLYLGAAGTAIPRQGSGTSVDWLKSPMKVPSKPNVPRPPARAVPDEWVPPDVDAFQPPVAEGISCPFSEIVSEAGSRVEELLDNLNRVTATESIQHQPVNRTGTLGRPQIQKYEYSASVEKMQDGTLNLNEYRRVNRDTFRAASDVSNDVSVENTFIHLLIFHPRYTANFRLVCEGLGTWKGQPAWQIHFEERPDRFTCMNVLIMHGRQYSPRVRGRTWILTDSYQIVRLEGDLVEPIPEARLRLWHQVIDYTPRTVGVGGQEEWLPSTSELYMDFRGHRFYRRHSYNDFHFFFVNVHQEFGAIW